MVQQLNTLSELQKVISGNSLVVVDFYATWCGPCKRIAPQIETLSQQETGVVFVKVDVDINADATSTYNVEAMPTFIVFKNGSPVETIVGANLEAIKNAIAKHK